MSERTVSGEEWYLFELLHGAHLAVDLWYTVGQAGEGTNEDVPVPVYELHPHLLVAFEKAAEAMADFYQAVGAVRFHDES